MEPNNMNINSASGQQPSAMPPEPASSAGTFVAVLVILAVLVIGGFYFWGQSQDISNDAQNTEQNQVDTDAAIEADLNATDVENVDYDLNPDNFNAS